MPATFIDALTNYRHPTYGVVSLYPDRSEAPDCANYHLFTAMSIRQSGDKDLTDCHLKFIAKCWVKTGLLGRFPDVKSDTAWDEFIGAAYTGWRAGLFEIAHSVLVYGLETDSDFDTEAPDVWSFKGWYTRNLMFNPFMRGCARLKVGMVSQILWSLGLLLSLFEGYGSTSGKNLCWIQVDPMQECGWITQVSIVIWRAFMGFKYKGGAREMLGIFLPGHPLAGYAPTHWGMT